jgi:hypothetical protein
MVAMEVFDLAEGSVGRLYIRQMAMATTLQARTDPRDETDGSRVPVAGSPLQWSENIP